MYFKITVWTAHSWQL